GRSWTAGSRQPPSDVTNDPLESAWGAAAIGDAARMLPDEPAHDDFGKLVRLHVRITALDASSPSVAADAAALVDAIDDTARAGYALEARFLRLELAISTHDVDNIVAHIGAFDAIDDDPWVLARFPASVLSRLLTIQLADDKALVLAEKLSHPGR